VDDCSNYDAAMIRRLSALLLLAVLGAALFAGCGKSSPSTNTTSVTTNPSVATGDTGSTQAQKQQYVAVCQHAVEGMTALPAAQRAKLKSSCENVSIGHSSRRQLAHEVCLAQASRLPSPAARARAQKLCRVK
jgi:hypothetical protein